MSTILVEPYSPTGIAGAREVWDNGGSVYMITLEEDPNSNGKYSTSSLVEKLVALGSLDEWRIEDDEKNYRNDGSWMPDWVLGTSL